MGNGDPWERQCSHETLNSVVSWYPCRVKFSPEVSMILVSPFQLKNPLICGNSCWNSLVNWWDGKVSFTSTCCPKYLCTRYHSSPQGRRIRRVFSKKKSSHLQMARARQKLLKFTFQDFGIDGLIKSRLRWLFFFFSDGWKDYWTHIFTWPLIRFFFRGCGIL